MKVICIGRNYSEHAKELNNPVPDEPVFFLKPDTAVLKDNAAFYHPDFSADIHHEIELVLRVSKAGKYISEEFAHNYIDAITVGIDFTARDVQQKCKERGLPWEKAKAFDGSAPIGVFIPFEADKDYSFSLFVNGERRQTGKSSDMLFSFRQIIAYISQFVTLKTGDLIFTGTPSGVARVNIGDTLDASLEEQSRLHFRVL
ncbi:MAG: fumarylacetoacetate hydrolase family protein [Bacteroidia bacterium]|jgi:2-keto-4-pentenoate hydratase/2-oxohepta-3-ene-1,7-dioic acid hydratase in catechol pathway